MAGEIPLMKPEGGAWQKHIGFRFNSTGDEGIGDEKKERRVSITKHIIMAHTLFRQGSIQIFQEPPYDLF